MQALDALFPTMSDHVMPGLGITGLFEKWADYNAGLDAGTRAPQGKLV